MSDLHYIRIWIIIFMVALMISGLTAVPLEWGTQLLAEVTEPWGEPWSGWSAYSAEAVAHVGNTYPMLFYGTDWLAFAHVVIALAFVGPYRDPVRNRWAVSYTHLRAHETVLDLVCRLLLEKKKDNLISDRTLPQCIMCGVTGHAANAAYETSYVYRPL